MIKKWLVTCQCDYCAEVWVSVIVKANTERKARIKAEQLLEKEGHKSIWIESCIEEEEAHKAYLNALCHPLIKPDR